MPGRFLRSVSLLTIPLLSILTTMGQSTVSRGNDLMLADTHNDILTTICTDSSVDISFDMTGKTHSDLARMKKGGLNWQFFSVWCDGNMEHPFEWANREIDSLYALASRNPDRIEIAYSPADVTRILKAKKLVAMTGVEGGHMIENDLDKLDSLYKRGVRYMTLTWNNSTDWASSAMDESSTEDIPEHKGLTDFGKEVIHRMNKLGMMVDLSHVGEQTFWDAIATSTKPVLASHSSAYALCPVYRNLKDDQIKAVAKNGGVICVNFFSGFIDPDFARNNQLFNEQHQAERDSLLKTVSDPYFADTYLYAKYKDEVATIRPPLSLLIDHIDYLVKLAGIDHVGIGSDFDGINSSPQEMDDVTDYPRIETALMNRGYSNTDISKIMGANVWRVYQANAH